MGSEIIVKVCKDDKNQIMAIYIQLAKGVVNETRELQPGLLVDLDINNTLLGVEMLRPGKVSIRTMRRVAKDFNAPLLNEIKPKQLVAAL